MVIEDLKSTPSTYIAFSILKWNITFEQNLLMKNGKKYTQLNLSKDMGVSRQMANTHFKRLKELGIIAEVFTTKGKLMAVNPNVCMVGESVPERIIELFKDTKYSKAMMAKVGINI